MKQNKLGNRGINRKALLQTLVVLAFIIIITVSGVVLLGFQAEEKALEESERFEDTLFVIRQGGTAELQETVAQPTILPEASGKDDAVSKDSNDREWSIGIITIEEERYNTLVVLEFTNLKAQPLDSILYDEDRQFIYEPYIITDGRIVFEAERLKEGTWYLAYVLPEGETSLGTSVVYFITKDEYDTLFNFEDKEPLARDEFGGAISE